MFITSSFCTIPLDRPQWPYDPGSPCSTSHHRSDVGPSQGKRPGWFLIPLASHSSLVHFQLPSAPRAGRAPMVHLWSALAAILARETGLRLHSQPTRRGRAIPRCIPCEHNKIPFNCFSDNCFTAPSTCTTSPIHVENETPLVWRRIQIRVRPNCI